MWEKTVEMEGRIR
jgi:hypothetical protein